MQTQYKLSDTIHNIILDYLDLYSKVSYAVYLKDISETNFLDKIIPYKNDICSMFEGDIDKIEFINNNYNIYSHELLYMYIENFTCVKRFVQLIKLYKYTKYYNLFDACIQQRNDTILKFIHDECNVHYMYDENNYKDERYNLKSSMRHLNCAKCLKEYNLFRFRETTGPMGPIGPVDNDKIDFVSREYKNISDHPVCDCGSCDHPKNKLKSKDKKVHHIMNNRGVIKNMGIKEYNHEKILQANEQNQDRGLPTAFYVGVLFGLSIFMGYSLYKQ